MIENEDVRTLACYTKSNKQLVFEIELVNFVLPHLKLRNSQYEISGLL